MRHILQLNQLLGRLIDSQIDFVLIGGFAGMFHGSTYVTRDLDVCTVLAPASVRRLREVLGDLHPRHRMTANKLSFLEFPEDGAPPVQNLYLSTDWGVIDILTNVIGVGDFERLKSGAERIPFQDKTCFVIGLDDLIKTKETLGREKDLPVVKQLRAIAASRAKSPKK
jgi:hypothetical protein